MGIGRVHIITNNYEKLFTGDKTIWVKSSA